MTRALATIVLALLVSVATLSHGQDAVGPAQRAAIYLRVVAYERGFAGGTRSPTLVVVGTTPESDEMSAAFAAAAARFTVAGRRIQVSRLRSLTAEQAPQLARQSVGAAYLADVSSVSTLAGPLASAGLLVMCASDPACAISIERLDARLRVVVGWSASSTARLDFDSRFLRTARVVR